MNKMYRVFSYPAEEKKGGHQKALQIELQTVDEDYILLMVGSCLSPHSVACCRRDTYEKINLYYVERHIKGYFKRPGLQYTTCGCFAIRQRANIPSLRQNQKMEIKKRANWTEKGVEGIMELAPESGADIPLGQLCSLRFRAHFRH